MTEQEINAWIAEKVCGWCIHDWSRREDKETFVCKKCSSRSEPNKRYVVGFSDFDPHNNRAQALDALEAWKCGHKGRCAVIYIEDENCVQLQGYAEIVDGNIFSAESVSHNLAHAICDALVKATGGA